jgi:serine/threonine-protein kinase
VSTTGSVDAGVGIGEIFIEKYRVDAILGHGGMGVVALCTHLALNEQVAIKMLRRDVLDDADAVERFMREAQAAVKLKSEFVARITDVGRSDTNVPYMVMEYLVGHDLGQLLDEPGSIGLPWAVEMTLQACEALCEAHSIGIVHRDIKPTNLFVTWRPDGSALIKVLDFGISKSPIISAMELTQTQSLLGTPAYMSPEQMRSARKVDARTDIWSLGTVLYELLERRRPFEAESFSEMCVKVAVDPPGPMANAPPALQQVVLRCLEKAPEHRYGSMAELAADLVQFSRDPHQAQVLVERMSRMLRRSQVIDWDPARHSMPMLAREVRSAERKAEAAAAAASDPALSAARATGSAARASSSAARVSGSAARISGSAAHVNGSAAHVNGSADRVKRSATMQVVAAPWRTWRRALLVAVALVAAATFGSVVSLMRDAADSSPPPADPPSIPAPSQPKPVAPGPAAPVGPGPTHIQLATEPVPSSAPPGAQGSAGRAGPAGELPGRDDHTTAAQVGPGDPRLPATPQSAQRAPPAPASNQHVKPGARQVARPQGAGGSGHDARPATKPPPNPEVFEVQHPKSKE